MARLSLIISLLLVTLPVRAGVSGELKLQQSWVAEDNPNPVADHYAVTLSSLRLLYQNNHGPFSWQGHYLLEGAFSEHWASLQSFNQGAGTEPVWDLTDSIDQGEQGEANQKIDRLWLMYSTGSWVIKAGRQAITWGSGRVFRPMDLFNPFSPTAKDTSYKPGADMLYLQYLYDSGADLQLLYVPRRDSVTGQVRQDTSSIAAKWLWFKGESQYQFLLAQDYEDKVLGLGVSTPVGQALLSTDVLPVWVPDNQFRWSWVSTLEYSWSWLDTPVTGFIEYYRNGYGHTDKRALDEQSLLLQERIGRGQLFNRSRDYLAAGLTVQYTALTTVSPTLIQNLHDHSRLISLSLSYDLSQNSRLTMGLRLPVGSEGSEYGGLKLSENSNTLVRSSSELYFRWAFFY